MLMSDQKYIRLCKSFYDKGILIKREDLHDQVSSDKEFYSSTYYYNQKQYEEFQKVKSVKGVKDVKTNILWWDFDDEEDPEKSRHDSIELIDRLKKLDVKEKDIEVYFSGKKGYNVIITLKKELSPDKVGKLCLNIGKNLQTLDTSLYDATQILRVPGTKHNKTGLFKIPLTIKQIRTQTTAEIKELAKSLNNIQEDFLWSSTEIDETKIMAEEPSMKETNKPTPKLSEILSKKPRDWKDYKWALLNAYMVKPDERHESLMRLAATCRALGYPIEMAKLFCLTFDEKFCLETKKEPVSDLETNILPSVYSEHWNGGQYSYKNDVFLQNYVQRIGLKPEDSLLQETTIPIQDAFTLFKDYATNIDKITIKTGIRKLDQKLRMTIGMSVGIVAPPSVGKCLGKDTPVIMFDGSVKKVQDVKTGDILMGDDSTPRTVLSTIKGQDNLYKVKQKNGEDYIVNSSHILSLKGCSSKKGTYNHNNKIDIEIEDYIKKSKEFKKRMKGYKVPVEFSKKELILDPYFLGYWLGNGTSATQHLTCDIRDIEIIKHFKEYAQTYDLKAEPTKDKRNNSCRISLSVPKGSGCNPLREKLKILNVLNNKHIPFSYKTSSREQRILLLSGLIDSDGYSTKRRDYEITFKNKQLAEDTVYLARSLGYKTTIKEKFSKCQNFNGSIYYRINISSDDFSELKLINERKTAIKAKRMRKYDLTEIKIEDAGFGDYYGFEIDGNKRFLLGDFTVTHNTTLSLQLLNKMSKSNEKCIFFSYDMYHALVFQKLAQKHLGISGDDLFNKFKTNDEEFQTKIVNVLKEEYKNVEFCFNTGQTPKDISDTIKRVEEESGEKVRLIVVDYNELVMSDFSDATQSSSYVAQKLNEIAKSNNVCVITLVQPNKMAGSPSDELKSYRNMKGSSALEQSFSVILGMWRPGYDDRYPNDDKFITINCLKNRMGSMFRIDLGWDGEFGRIYELSDEQEEHLQRVRDRKKAEENNDDSGGWS